MSTETKVAAHTPGPWRIEYDGDECEGAFTLGMASYLDNPGCYTSIHSIQLYEGLWKGEPGFEEAKANVRLIAAAPEMLEALEDIAETLDKMAPCPEEILDALLATAQSAIRAARGAGGGRQGESRDEF